jgi:carbon-monoxide dehydrogenase medium subunit
MYPAAFEYHAPKNVKEALGLLGKLKDDAKILAGGHSLIPMMKLRLAQPKHLIDLRKVPGLSGIKADGKALTIGAMTTHWEVESSAGVKSKLPVLAEVAAVIGDPAVRNLGTVGGAVAHADPAADWPAVMIALGAEFVVEGRKGKRKVKVDDWFKGLMATALKDDEILVQIRVPLLPAGSGAAYMKFPHPASRFAVVGVAAAVTLDKQGVCANASVAVTGAGTKAVRAKGVEGALKGKKLDAAAIEAAAQKAAEGVDVQADLQGSVEYKSHLCRVFAKRAITEAVKRAGGK